MVTLTIVVGVSCTPQDDTGHHHPLVTESLKKSKACSCPGMTMLCLSSVNARKISLHLLLGTYFKDYKCLQSQAKS